MGGGGERGNSLKGRRAFLRDLASLGGSLAAWQLLAGCTQGPPPAQPPARSYRVGVLRSGVDADATFFQRLTELGYVEGRNLVVETRAGVEGDTDEAAQARTEE